MHDFNGQTVNWSFLECFPTLLLLLFIRDVLLVEGLRRQEDALGFVENGACELIVWFADRSMNEIPPFCLW